MRGLILGAVSGLALSVVALGGLSLVAPQPAGNEPPQAPVTDTPVSELAPDESAASPDAPVSEAPVSDATAAPGLAAPEGSDTPEADLLPAAQPVVGAAADMPATPDMLTGSPQTETSPEDRVSLGPQTPAPRPPVVEEPPQALPAEPPPADAAQSQAPALDMPVADDVAEVSGPDEGFEPAPLPAVPETEGETLEQPPATDDASAAPPEAALDLLEPDEPDTGSLPLAMYEGDEVAVGTQVALLPISDPDPAPETEIETMDAPAPRISLQGEAPRLPGGENGVIIRRPGGDDAETVAEPETEAEPALPPIWAAAAGYDLAADLPPVAVILIDDGSLPLGAEIAASLGLPVTVALDPAAPDAGDLALAYHAANVEVAALAALPDGATPTDAVVALQASFATLPDAVALVDASGSVAASRDLAQAVVGWLGPEGRGLAWLALGADHAARVAESGDVPARAILRDLDGNGQEEAVIRRFLDNAPMRARQDGAAVLLARLRPETVNALSLWSATARAGSVTLVPLSVALTAGLEMPAGE